MERATVIVRAAARNGVHVVIWSIATRLQAVHLFFAFDRVDDRATPKKLSNHLVPIDDSIRVLVLRLTMAGFHR